jgi:hypothetical protein
MASEKPLEIGVCASTSIIILYTIHCEDYNMCATAEMGQGHETKKIDFFSATSFGYYQILKVTNINI